MFIIFSVFLAGLILFVIALIVISPGKPAPIQDKPGNPLPRSISEKTFININGVEQGMFIRSRDSANPVILYLHGGLPDYFLTKKYPPGFEDQFTVVWWEQRGP